MAINMPDVSINGVYLTDISPYIIIQQITENAPQMQLNAVQNGNGVGQRFIRSERNTIDVTVKFAINLHKGKENLRSEILDLVNAWSANGGTLKLKYKTGRHLDVLLSSQLATGNLRKWNGEYTIVFRSLVPYWISNSKTQVDVRKTSGSATEMQIASNANTFLQFDITVDHDTNKLKNFSVESNGTKIDVTGIELSKNETVKLYYFNGFLRINMYDENGKSKGSALRLRTPESNDDIVLKPGMNKITFSGSTRCNWSFYAEQRWM